MFPSRGFLWGTITSKPDARLAAPTFGGGEGRARYLGLVEHKESVAMRPFVAALVLALALGGASVAAQAKGCIKGAVIGGVAGHYAGHHGWLGAAAGCLRPT
jgi:hypothetical protein